MTRCVRFLPSECAEHCPVLLDEDGAVRENASKKDMSRRVDFGAWLLAWDRYALGAPFDGYVAWARVYQLPAAAVLNQLSFIAAMKHKAVVAEVACGAASKGRSPILGVLFDEVSRSVCRMRCICMALLCDCVRGQYWEEESGKKGDRFRVESMIGTGAAMEHEMRSGPPPPRSWSS